MATVPTPIDAPATAANAKVLMYSFISQKVRGRSYWVRGRSKFKMDQDSKVQDYECFVRSVLQDFDERVFAVQKRTEENVKGEL